MLGRAQNVILVVVALFSLSALCVISKGGVLPPGLSKLHQLSPSILACFFFVFVVPDALSGGAGLGGHHQHFDFIFDGTGNCFPVY